jgi:sulfoxide reductase catalytic subunit YedY
MGKKGSVMLIRKSSDIQSSEITPRATYEAFQGDRRRFLAGLGSIGAAAAAASLFPRGAFAATTKLTTVPSAYTVNETVTPEAKAQSYNNFYEFGTDKSEPAHNARTLRTRPWTVSVEGLVKKPQTLDIDTIMRYRPLEDRTYRFRCVEAWSMVIPWNGYSLAEFIKAMEPLPSAKFVQFISLADRTQMPDLGSSGINPPYSEGLRMDEAMNPLTLLTFGSYGETLANQQGAPIRVIVPWKYGFKSAKSIVKIRFVEKMPHTTWNDLNSDEYGFYSNVNPSVNHPRWSQAHERRLDGTGGIFPKSIPTLPFNGYANEVAGMYQGMDLKKFY